MMRLRTSGSEAAVATMLTLVVAAYIAMALGFAPESRIIPLTIGVPVFGLAVANLLRQVRFSGQPDSVTASGRGSGVEADVPNESLDPGTVEECSESGSQDIQSRDWRQSGMIWLAILAVALFLGGYAIGMPLFMIVFLLLYARKSWPITLAMTGITMAIIWFGFVRTLGVPVFPGFLF